MDILRPAKVELKSAESAILSMKNAKIFDEFEEAWKIYLSCIEKCWIKVERCCQSVKNEFEPWQGQYTRLRKKDMLLRYIYHARNADQHTIQETVKQVSGGFSIRHSGGSGYIKSLKIVNGVITEHIGSPIIVENYPSKVELLRFKDNSDWYNPPTQHFEETLINRDPISVAQKGLEFYSKFLKEAEEKFADEISAS